LRNPNLVVEIKKFFNSFSKSSKNYKLNFKILKNPELDIKNQ